MTASKLPLGLLLGVDHLREARRLGMDQVVDQQHRERLVAHQVARAPDRVAQAQGLLLAGIDHGAGRGTAARSAFRSWSWPSWQRLEQLEGAVEMILDHASSRGQ